MTNLLVYLTNLFSDTAGKFIWLFKRYVGFQKLIWGLFVGIGIFVFRLFIYAINFVCEKIQSLSELSFFDNSGSIGSLLDFANYIFPVTETFYIISFLMTLAVIALAIRTGRSFIPTMT